ncbi:RNHCP domain-containing protein [Streptomyces sp. NPDC006879]|uniref:RNHCP domain-containing protein n=1 Tax=Streptomyces sp. NPDC006879 TaxID=3364767 RepID=UPI00369AB53C
MSNTNSAHRSAPNNRPSSSADTFVCTWCTLTLPGVTAEGQRRHHCPSCLHAQHVEDARPEGDPSECHGRMGPIALAVLPTGEWRVIHRCAGCDMLSSNPVSGEDNPLLLLRMAVRPLAQPPFPLETLGSL